MTKSGIYKIVINGKAIVGKAVDLARRHSQHIYELKNRKHYNSYLQKAYNKYGEFNFEILEETTEWLSEKEIMWISQLDTYEGEGYNLTAGGEGLLGEDNPFYGKTHSAETKRKMRAAKIGGSQSAETRKKISKRLSGEKHPLYGTKHSAETIRKMSEAKRGKKNKQYGKLKSEETRKLISEGCRKAWAERRVVK